MTTIFDSARLVKTSRPFGDGIPARRKRFVPTLEDEAWWAANAPSNVEPEPDWAALAADWNPPAVDWDALAAEAEALDRLERGLCC